MSEVDPETFAEGWKMMSQLLAKGWSCPGRGKDVVKGCIPAEGWRSPDGRVGINLFDAFVEEGLVNLSPEEIAEVRRGRIHLYDG